MENPPSSQKSSSITYIPQGEELDVALACFDLHFPLMLRGPTGSGKTTLVSTLAQLLNTPLIEEPCNEDTLAADLIGRNRQEGWIDGSATASLRYPDGAIYYLDELGEARQDVMVVVHSLTDDRRVLPVRAHNETLQANDRWILVSSYNPLYQLQNRVKPSTAQRFITIDIPHPLEDLEKKIVSNFVYSTQEQAVGGEAIRAGTRKYTPNPQVPIKELVKLANDYRRMAHSADSMGIREGPGTRLVARTAKLIAYGLSPATAIEVGMINPLTYESEQQKALKDIASKLFKWG